jgi:hypothetical protein
MTLRLESGSNVKTVKDTDGDGLLSFNSILWGSVEVNIVAGFSKPLIGSLHSAELDLLSGNVNFLGGEGRVKISLVDDKFSLPLPVGTQLHGVGSVGGTISAPHGITASFKSWVDTANSSSLPVTPSGSFIKVLDYGVNSPNFVGSFAQTESESFSYSGGEFSLFTEADLYFKNGGNITFDSLVSVHTPEVASIVLFGTGLFGIASVVRRRQQKTAKALE